MICAINDQLLDNYTWNFKRVVAGTILYFLWINPEPNLRFCGWFVWRFATATFTPLQLEFSLSTLAVSWIADFVGFCRTATHGYLFAEYSLLLLGCSSNYANTACAMFTFQFSIVIHSHWMQSLNYYPWSGLHGFYTPDPCWFFNFPLERDKERKSGMLNMYFKKSRNPKQKIFFLFISQRIINWVRTNRFSK